jgi:hypothetical protein
MRFGDGRRISWTREGLIWYETAQGRQTNARALLGLCANDCFYPATMNFNMIMGVGKTMQDAGCGMQDDWGQGKSRLVKVSKSKSRPLARVRRGIGPQRHRGHRGEEGTRRRNKAGFAPVLTL